MNVKVIYVGGHVEVWDKDGHFMFYADNQAEALEELHQWEKDCA